MRRPLDALIIAGDAPQEVLGRDERERMRLTVDGIPASLPFLRAYFESGRRASAALETRRREEPPFLSLNGPFLVQSLRDRGLDVEWVPFFSAEDRRLADLLDRRPATVAISTTFLPFASQIDAVAAAVKRRNPDTWVVAGGIQVWKSFRHARLADAGGIDPDILPAVAEHSYLVDPARPSPVDGLIVSESGERTLAALIERRRAGTPLDDLPNLARFVDGRWRLARVEPEPGGEVRVDWSRFLPRPAAAYVPVQAGVGCGHRCSFCDFSGLRSRRVRPLESVLAEIRSIPPHEGLRRVYFTDDNLFASRRRALDLCRALTAAKLGVRWRGMVRVSSVDDEVAARMAESGCLEVLLGVESGDAGMLRRMRKRTSPDQILAGVGFLHRHGIHTKSTFIVGFPGETEASIRNTAALLNAYPTDGPAVHRYLFFQFAVLPLSEAASPDFRRRYNLRGYGSRWSHATMVSEEAAAWVASVQDDIKLDLSPSYVLETPDLPGLSVEGLKEAFRLRNRLARVRRRLPDAETEGALWDRLESVLGPSALPARA